MPYDYEDRYIPEGYYLVEDADGERLVRKDELKQESNMTESSTFLDKLIEANAPRVIVRFRKVGDQVEYEWGTAGGAVPLIEIIGAVGITQIEILDPTRRQLQQCPEPGLLIVWNKDDDKFYWFIHPTVPLYSMWGMLEMIKATLVGTSVARQAASQQVPMAGKPVIRPAVLGIDGKPFMR